MGCDTLFEINTRIFDEFFRNDNDLSNLYDFLVVNNNEFCIDNITTAFLQNSSSGALNANAFFEGSPATDYNCNLESGFATFSNIVKDTANNEYNLELYSANTNHYIPQFSTTIIQYITDAKKLKMKKIFNIYQIYDYLVNNPDTIATNNLSGLPQLYDYFDAIQIDTANTECPISGLNHKNYIEDELRGKLTPSIVYVCRGIYLVLLYKHIADVYLTYYKICDDLTDPSNSCGELTKTNIKTVLKQFSAVTNKIKEFSGYYLNVVYDSGIPALTIYTEGAAVISFFELLETNKHTIYNKTKRKYITIKNNISISSDKSNYPLTAANIEGTIDSNFADNDKCVILSKNIEYSSQVYNDSLNNLSITNETFNKNKSEYQKSIGNYNAIQGSFNNIDYIYYLTIIIVIISLIAIVATNSEQSRKTRVFIILVIVLLTYGMIFSFIEVAKRFTENFSTTTDIISEKTIINNNFDMYLRIIYMESSNYGMTRLYDTLTDASNKEAQNVRNNNKVLESSTNRNDATTNAEWHRLFQRTLFIHTTFLFLILVLTYLWLSTIMPDMNIYLLFITIIASMILIFYYFRNLHRVVRTEYKHRYWTKMSV